MNNKQLLGEHYNARGLSPQMVARTFVPPPQFESVSAVSNCILVGPRGSGKTTLLRMLDPRAVIEAESSKSCGRLIDYVGVFVPIDTAWVSSLTNTLQVEDGEDASGIYLAVYSLAVARSLVDIMRWRVSDIAKGTQFHVDLSSEKEIELAGLVSNLWLGVKARSLLELRLMISSEIAGLPRRWKRSGITERKRLVADLLNPLDSAAGACDLFNVISGEEGRKWALLCDELEIAPESVQKMLFGALRAAPQPLLLKYSITPRCRIPLVDYDDQPISANDYDLVPLTYATREEGMPERERERFCVAIWSSVLKEVYPEKLEALSNPFKVLETPGATGRSERNKSADEGEGLDKKFGRMFRELADNDESFANYLKKKHVFLEDLDRSSSFVKDSVIRKIRPIVEVRNYYFSGKGERRTRASRKSFAPYCGAKRLFALSEGHPRWLKYTLAAMLGSAKDSNFISVADQSRELSNSLHRIESRIHALPAKGMSTRELLDVIGEFFQWQVLGEDFRADPSLSFTVDEAVSPEVLFCLEQALYIGAVIPMRGDLQKIFSSGLAGQRFRLSNWLAPLYKLPLVAGKSVNLSSVLSKKFNGMEFSKSDHQLSLGFDV